VCPCPCTACIVDYSIQSQVTAPKTEPATPTKSLRNKRAAPVESSSDDEDDVPLASSPAKQSAGTSKVPKANGHKAVKAESDGTHSSAPTKKKRASAKKEPPQKKMKRDPDASEPSASEGEEFKPVKKEKAPKKRKSKAKEETDADADDETPKPAKKRATAKKVKDEANGSVTPQPKKKKGKVDDEGEEEEAVYRWWEAQQNNDGEVKWQTLEHNGVIFPPPYEPLPSNVKMRYKGMWSSYCSCWSGGA